MVRTSDFRLRGHQFDSQPLQCQPAYVNSAFHPSGVGKSSTRLRARRVHLCHATDNAQYTPPTPTRQNCRVSSRRRCVHEFATSSRQFRRVVGVNTPIGSRELGHGRRLRCAFASPNPSAVVTGGVYWALNPTLCAGTWCKLRHFLPNAVFSLQLNSFHIAGQISPSCLWSSWFVAVVVEPLKEQSQVK